MPNWKKLIVSGSDASLNSLNVATNVTAQSFTGSLFGTASFASTASFVNPLVQNVLITGSLRTTGSIVHTGSAGIYGTGRYLLNVGQGNNNTSAIIGYGSNNSIELGWGNGGAFLTTTNNTTLYLQGGYNGPTNTGTVALGLDLGTTTSAKLQVRGSGSTSTTNAFLVQNSNASSSFYVRDDGGVIVNTYLQFASDGSGGNYLYFTRNGSNVWTWGTSGIGNVMTISGNTTTLPQVTYTTNGLNVTPGGNSTTQALGVTVGSYPSATIASFSSGSVTALHISGSGLRGTGSFNYLGSITATSFTGSFSGSVAAPGATTQIVYNNSGVLAANSGFVYSGSNVGVGATSPAAKLDVAGNILISGGDNQLSFFAGSQTGYRLYRDSTTMVLRSDGNIREDAGSNYIINTNGSERMRVTDGGNVGIGTSSPVEKLSLAGSTATTFGLSLEPAGWNTAKHRLTVPTSGDTSMWSFNWNGSTVDSALYAPASILLAQGTITFNTTGSANSPAARMIINTVGNVGIGTTSPSYKLDVSGSFRVDGTNGDFIVDSTGNDIYFTRNGSNYFIANQASSAISFLMGAGVSQSLFLANNGNVAVGATSTSGYKLYVAGDTWIGGTTNYIDGTTILRTAGASEVMRIASSGNVGIGTTSPSARLHISGSTDATQRIIVDGSGNNSSLHLNYNGSNVGFINSYQNSELNIGTAVSAFVNFYTNNTERMRIAAGGNVGIGTTSPSYKLDVYGNPRFYGDGNHIYTRISSGASNKDSKILIGNDAERFNIGLAASSNTFSINSSNGGTPTSINIDYTSGDVGIGTTSPSQKLDVAGAISISGSVVDYEVAPALIGGVTTSNIISFTPGTHYAAFVDYVIKDSAGATNQRVGTIQISISQAAAAAVMNEVVTADIGNTTAITFAVSYGAPTWLTATNSGPTPYDINYMVRYF